jgi:tetratricopeptide (TPR) repeat protein
MNQQIDLAFLVRLFNESKYQLIIDSIKVVKIDSIQEEIRAQTIHAAALLRLGKTSESLELIDKLTSNNQEPDVELYNIRGVALRSSGRLTEAKEWMLRGKALYPESIDITHNLAVTVTDLGELEHGAQLSEEVRSKNPKHIESYKNLGRIYITLRDTTKAKAIFTEYEKIDPNHIDILVGFGAAAIIDEEINKAIEYFEKAIKRDPNQGSAWGNLGLCYKLIGEYSKAKKCLFTACKVDPEQVEHPWNLALIQLTLGEMKEGWSNYEIRFDPRRIATDRVKMPATTVPRLQKKDNIKNKTVLMLQEQGFGDTLQFYRFARELKKDGAKKVIAIVSPELVHVIRTIPWIDEVRYELLDTHELPDYWVYPMSLPNRYEDQLAIEIPAPIPYLGVFEEKYQIWNQHFNKNKNKKLRVGLLWAGRKTHTNDKNRSMQLRDLAQLAKYQDRVEFVSLQKGEREDDDAGVPWDIQRCADKISDFSDTAAILENMDLLISVDSGPIHLAGAMGMPVWLMLPRVFDFRWMVDRLDSPWYPTVKLFRQESNGKWDSVVKKIDQELGKLLQQNSPRWTTKRYHIHPNLLNTTVAGVNLFLYSAYEYHQEGKLEIALALYQEVLAYEPKNSDAIRNVAAIYRALNQIPQALACYQQGIAQGESNSIFYSNYGNLLNQLNDFNGAIHQANRAIELDANNSQAWYIRSDAYFQLGQLENALVAVQRAVSLSAEFPYIVRKVLVEIELCNWLAAKESLEQLKVIGQETTEYHLLLAHLYKETQEFDLSLKCYEKSLTINPNHDEAYMNRGVLKANMLDYDGAIEDVNKALRLAPENAEAHFNLSLFLLTQGRFEEGWPEYEWRMDPRRTRQERVQKPSLQMPMWQGESLQGKAILLMPEQGFGDYFQFVRYAQYLKSLGAIVIAAAPAPLVEILKACPWVDQVAQDGDQISYHCWVFPMSLPFFAKTSIETIPKTIPYLKADPQKIIQWRDWLKANGFELEKPIIGICWQGAKTHKHDRQRSIHPQDLDNLIASHPQYQFIGIVKEPGALASYKIGKSELINAGPVIQYFSDTAALLENLDHLITIDSAPAHLAGALGIPTWIMLDSLPDFRWMLDRTDSPWYPTVTLYRKPLRGNWTSVLNQISKNLTKLNKKRPRNTTAL